MKIELNGTKAAGRHALVDPEDYERVAALKWHLGDTGYACHASGTRKAPVRHKMHRFILGLEPGDEKVVDHINGDRLDNRRSNLRVTDQAGNRQNVPAYSNGRSRFRGVCWHKAAGKWTAQCQVAGKYHYLGLFEDEAEAASVVSAFRARHMPLSADAVTG